MRLAITYAGTSALLFGAIQTMRLWYMWPNLTPLECMALVAIAWGAVEGHGLARGK